MSKKIADLDLNDSEFLNTSLTDFYSEDLNDPLELDSSEEQINDLEEDNSLDSEDSKDLETANDDFDDNLDDNLDNSIEKDEDATNIVDNEKPDSLDDYNTLALLALSLKDEDPDLIDFEIDKDIKPEILINNLKTKISKTREDVSKEVQEAYGEAARYLNLILEGASQEDVTSALSYNQIASLELTGNEEEDLLEKTVLSWLNLKGVPDPNDLIEVYKDKGILLDKAKESVEFHRKQEELFFEQWKENRDLQIVQAQKAQLEYQKAIRSHINKGVVKGLSIKDKKKFEDDLFKPTEIVEVIDQTGRKKLEKVPLIRVKMEEFQQDIEQQLAMQLLILDGFDFTSLVDKAKKKVNTNLIQALNDRTSSTTGKRSSSTYFED